MSRKRPRRRAAVSLHRRLAIERLEDRRVLSSAPPAASSPGVGININSLTDYSPDLLFANAMMTSRAWGSPYAPYDEAATTDAQGWPTEDAGAVVTDPTGGDAGGTYALSFTGQAANIFGVLSGNVQVLNKQYNSNTNTTTATVVVPAGESQLYLSFTGTQRLPTSALDTGITNVVLMRPTVTDGSIPYSAGTLFTTPIENLISNFQVIRFMDYSQTNNNSQVNWSDRTLPSAATQQATNGGAWEYAVALANATNKDMWINIPEGATPAYITDLAELIKYGSDGVNPYTSPQASPVYAPLNANLKVYFEYSNEVWNFGFSQAQANENAALAEVAAGNSPLNYDGNTEAFTLATRRVVEQTVVDSNIFRSVFGDAAMMTQIRPVYEWQYDNLNNTAQTGFDFLNDYYNNTDGQSHVATAEPPNYYLWGGGGAWYYGVNDTSGNGDVVVPNYSFETSDGWTFSGTAGIVANNSALGNASAPDGTQAAYVQSTGSFSESVTFSGGYADISFNASRNFSGNESFEALYDGTPVGPFSYQTFFQPTTNSYVTDVTVPFMTTAGAHTITFVGQGGSGSAFIDNVQVQTVNAMFNSGIQSIASLVATETQWATAYGLQMTSYEGGFHVGGDSPTPLQVLANLDPRAQAAEASGIADFFQNGGDLAMFYDTTNLSYELTDDLDNLNTPKLLAITAAIASGLPSPTIGTTLPSTIGQSVTIPEVSSADFATGRMTNATIFLVQTATGGTFSIQVQGSQQFSSSSEYYMVDGQVVPTATSLASGSSSPPVTFTISSGGLHAISLLADGTSNIFLNGSAVITAVTPPASLATAATVTANINPSVVGQWVTLTATIGSTTSTTNLPSGAVTFYDGTNALGTGTLSVVNGVDQTTFVTSSLAVGSHSITVVYNGDVNFTGSTSAALAQVIGPAATTTSVASNVAPATFGQLVTFTAMVGVISPGAGTPTGGVTFYDGANCIGTGTLSVVNGTVQTTMATSSLAVGSHSITAVYGGDSNFTTSTSSAFSQTVGQSATTTSLASSVAPAMFGQSVTFTATIGVVSPGVGTPTGTVTFQDGTNTLGTGTLSVVNGVVQATFTTSSLSVATHSITAVYGGDTNFATSTSTVFTEAIGQAATTTSLASSVAPATFGQSVTFTATIAVVSPGVGTPTGTVSFQDGTNTLGTGTLSVVNGVVQATFTTSSLSVATHSITAVYGGDANFATSTSTVLTEAIGQATTTTSLASNVSPATFGQSTTFTATIAVVSPGVGTPTGTVTFIDGSNTLGTGTLSVVNGVVQATFTTSNLAVATHSITAVYGGDSNFATSTSTSLTQVVSQAVTTTSVASNLTPVTFGQSVTFTATIAVVSPGAGVPTGTVTFKDGANALGTGTLSVVNGAVQATYTTSALTAGSHSITAIYNGDANFATGTSTVFTQAIGQAGTTGTIASSLNPDSFGQTLTFTATIAAVSPGISTPTGSVTFFDGTSALGSGTLSVVNGADQATLVTSSLAVGSHSITAVYGGDTNFTTSTSAIVSQTVGPALTAVTVINFENLAVSSATLVEPEVLSGFVFTSSGTSAGNALMVEGTSSTPWPGQWPSSVLMAAYWGSMLNIARSGGGTFNLNALDVESNGQAGSAVITGYNASGTVLQQQIVNFTFNAAGYSAVTANLGWIGVTKVNISWWQNSGGTGGTRFGAIDNLHLTTGSVVATTTGVSSNATTSTTAGQPVTFTSTVSATSGSGVPSGTVTFFDGTNALGTGTLNVVNGVDQATYTGSLMAGSHSITAVYGGDANFTTSTSTAVAQTIGQGATAIGVVSSLNPAGFSQAVTFTATVGLVSGVGAPTGSVTFYDGTTALGTGTLSVVNGADQATLATSSLAVGSHSISAVYGGDTNFITSTSSALSQSVASSSTTITVINFEGLTVSSATLAEPAVLSGFAFTSSGTSGGNALMIEGTSSAPWPGLWPSTVLMSASWGSTINITKSGGGTYNLNALDVESNGQAGSAVIIGYNAAGAVVQQQIVNFTFNAAGYSTVTANLGWVGVAKVNVSWWQNANGGGGTRFGAIDNLHLSTGTIATATTTLSSNIISSTTAGQTVTLTATVSLVGSGSGIPTGTVTFFNGSSALGTGTLSIVNGVAQATFSTTSLTVGSHSFTAAYNGDANFAANTSAIVTQSIGQGATTTSVASSINPTTLGQSTTFTATVALVSGVGAPTGTVTFYNGTTALGTGTLSVVNGSDQATLATGGLSVGGHSITAVYGGDANFTTSTSPTLSQSVGLGATTANVSSNTNPAALGQTITLTATVAAVISTSNIPTGTITFKDGTTILGTGTLSVVNGIVQSTLATSSLVVGSNSITAVYSGDTNFATSTATALAESVGLATSTTSVASNANPAVFGQSITLSATVGSVTSNTNVPTGTVTFKDGTITLGTGTLSVVNGTDQAILITTGSLAVATHSITALYGGDSNFTSSTSTALAEVINKASSTSSLTSSLLPSSFGQLITLTAALAPVSPGAGTPTGAVTFKDGTTILGTGTLSVVNGIDQVTLATSGLAVGSHSLTAVYAGDTNFTTSTSVLLAQTITQSASTASVTSNLSSPVFGQSITFTAAVAAASPGAGTPTGSVTFFDGTNSLGVGTLSVVNGVDQATLATGSLAIGSHSITAVYGGDTNFTTITSAVFSQTIAQSSTTNNVTSSLASAAFGQSVTFTATIKAASPGSGTPTGSVTFFDGTNALGAGTLSVVNGVGQATLATGSLSVGSHSITAVYGGDTNFITSTSAALSQSVGLAATTTGVTSNTNPATLSQSITFTATVAAVVSTATAPTGTVTFKDGTTILGTGTLSLVGAVYQAMFTTSSLAIGSHSITAVYAGDTNFATSTSSTVAESVGQSASTTSIASNAAPAPFGQSITFTATVAAASSSTNTPTGTVTFKDGTTVLGTGTLAVVNGAVQATLATSSLAVGSHSITAVYGGDSNFAGSTSTAFSQTIAQAATTTNVSSSINPSTFGQSFTLTATVAVVSPGAGTPTGNVTFFDGTSALGTGALGVVNGLVQATFSTSSVAALAAGSHSITAVYGGDSKFTTSTSAVLSQTISQAGTTASVSSNLNPDGFGQLVTFTATVAAVSPGVGAPAGSVTFFDGTTALGTGTLSVVNGADQAILATSNLAIGSHSISAVYGGSSNFNTSTSTAVTQTVATSSTTASSINFENLVVSSATQAEPLVLNGFAFTSSGTSGGSALLVEGTSSTPWPGFWPSTVLMAAYWGSTLNIAKSGGGTFNLNALDVESNGQAGSAVITGYSASGAVLKQQIVNFTFNAAGYSTVTANLGWVGVAKANVSWWQNSNGTGGTRFGAIDNVNLSTGAVAATNTSLSSNNTGTPTVGQPVTFTAAVSLASSGSGVPTGTVTFYDGSNVLGTGTLSVVNGVDQATFTASSLTAGSHSITAAYGGDANFTTSTSTAITQTVGQGGTTASVASNLNPAGAGQLVTFTAAVAVANGSGAPTGGVTFYDGTTALGSGTLSVVSGVDQASFSTSSLAIGGHTITAVYAGNANFTGSTSTAITQTVTTASTTATTINFENLPVSSATLAEPLAINGFAFTSTGTSAGNALMIEGQSSAPWPGLWPSNVLMAAYWGTVLNIAKSGGGNFNLNALDVESNGQAGSAVITGYSASGAVLQQQIVNFSFNAAGYSTVTANLGWVGIAKVSIGWYQNANGTGGTRFGAVDNLNLSTGS